jgi:integrase
MRYGVSIGLLETDPTAGIKAPAPKSRGIYTWTDDEIDQYRQGHEPGTNARLALELLIGTAQRKSDVVRMGHQHVRGDMLHVRQEKTGWEGDIPIGPDLAAALATAPTGNLTFLTTSWGKPYTAAGFGNHFREWCNKAGRHARCTSHGLRKPACRQLAEAGCTPHEIRGDTGHITLAEVQRYTKAVDQAALARAAAKKRTRIGEPADRFAKTEG